MHAHKNSHLVGVQALSRALPGDASVYLLLGMLRNAKGNKEEAANAYAAAVRISLVSVSLLCFTQLCSLPFLTRLRSPVLSLTELKTHQLHSCCMGPS